MPDEYVWPFVLFYLFVIRIDIGILNIFQSNNFGILEYLSLLRMYMCKNIHGKPFVANISFACFHEKYSIWNFAERSEIQRNI